MWSYKIEPLKCIPLMEYESYRRGNLASDIVEFNTDLRVFKFHFTYGHDAGPNIVSVVPSTWEGDAQNDILNVWRRTVTYSNPCPASVFTAKTDDITYILNSGSMIIDVNHFTTDPEYCMIWMTTVRATSIPEVAYNRIDDVPN